MSDITRGTTYTGNIPSASSAHALVDDAVINKEFITNKTATAVASGDYFVFSDASDSNALKKVSGLGLIDAFAGTTGSALIVAGSSQAGLAALGAGTIGSLLFAAGSIGAVHTALGIGATGSALMETATAIAARTVLSVLATTDANFKIGSFKRDISATSGSQTITGVGFQPRCVDFLLCGDGTNSMMSDGFDNGSACACRFDSLSNTYSANNAYSMIGYVSGSYYCTGSISSMDADGFTVNWSKAGTPTGSVTIYYKAQR